MRKSKGNNERRSSSRRRLSRARQVPESFSLECTKEERIVARIVHPGRIEKLLGLLPCQRIDVLPAILPFREPTGARGWIDRDKLVFYRGCIDRAQAEPGIVHRAGCEALHQLCVNELLQVSPVDILQHPVSEEGIKMLAETGLVALVRRVLTGRLSMGIEPLQRVITIERGFLL